jgi:hypothetical protein
MLDDKLVTQWVLFSILDELKNLNAILAYGLKVPERETKFKLAPCYQCGGDSTKCDCGKKLKEKYENNKNSK